MSHRPTISDLLGNLADRWNNTEAAKEFKPLPKGNYVGRLETLSAFRSRTNDKPGVKLAFKVVEGDYAGHPIWHELYLTPEAMPFTKRELGKLGVTAFEQLENPPKGIICEVQVILRSSDEGKQFNRVTGFKVLRVEQPEPGPFGPASANPVEPCLGHPNGEPLL